MAEACSSHLHEFWPDDVSVLQAEVIDSARLHGPLQLTDASLLALARRHGGRLVSFDTGVAKEVAIGTGSDHLIVL